jgi:hypothetical protein
MSTLPSPEERQTRALTAQHVAQALVDRLAALPDPVSGPWAAWVYTPAGAVRPEWRELVTTLHPNLAGLDKEQARLQAALTQALAPECHTILLELTDAWAHGATAQADAAFVLGVAVGRRLAAAEAAPER